MKLVKASIWFVVILFPLLLINRLHVQDQLLKEQVERTYNRAVDTAVDDAVTKLNQTGKRLTQEAGGYESPKHVALQLNEAVHTLWESLSIQLQAYGDEQAVEHLASFIPIMIVIGYDGFYMNSWDEYRDEAGELRLHHIWSPKHPYIYTDHDGVIYSFTLDDYVTIYDPASRQWTQGYQRELQHASSLELLQDSKRYEEVRMQAIIDVIQLSAAAQLNRYNQKYSSWGRSIQFTFPSIPDEEWHNTLQDVGMLVWMQGHQYGARNDLRFAYGGARMIISDRYYATVANGIKRVFPAACKPNNVLEVFDSKLEAAQAGYYPSDC